ncbi:hypothetical protein EU537_06845 [Candidatus Thorarchaeota archaeon]|nr:MAG: hypothetical protein EU537_06845 [Candidatus Thorarchaeota archaeon]
MPALVGIVERTDSCSNAKRISQMLESLSHGDTGVSTVCISGSDNGATQWCATYPRTYRLQNVDYRNQNVFLCHTHQMAPQNAKHISCLLGNHDIQEKSSFISRLENSLTTFIMVVEQKDHRIVIRSQDGQIPLYVAANSDRTIFSTQRKALWNLNMPHVAVVFPGDVLTLRDSGHLRVESSLRTGHSFKSQLQMKNIYKNMETLLLNSFSKLRGVDKAAVLFSGGVDSSMAVLLSRKYVDDLTLISAFGDESKDQKVAESHARMLDMDVQKVLLDFDLIWHILPEVIYSIETTNAMDVEIAIPFFLSARLAASNGRNLLISGQGPDEIFAGYARHVRIFKERGQKALQHELIENLSITHEANIARDMKAIEYSGCEAFFPYLSPPFVQYGLSIPPSYKIAPEGLPRRKVIFRKICTRMGLPEAIANKVKSATQYSSGSSKLLLKGIAENIKKLKGASKRDLRRALPDVLKQIGYIVGIPVRSQREIASENELEHAYRFSRYGRLPAFNQWEDNN